MRNYKGEKMLMMASEVKVQEVETFRYLVRILTDDQSQEEEIKASLDKAKEVFNKSKRLFYSSMNLETRKRSVKCYLWSILVYASSTRTMGKRDMDNTEVLNFEYTGGSREQNGSRRMSNEKSLIREKENRAIFNTNRKEMETRGYIRKRE